MKEEEKKVSLSELDYWTDKWGVSEVQLKEAIERTDSQDPEVIEKWLIDHNYLL